ncbi:M20/M25/M40 family metallo-hydrolase [Saliniramus sp.]|uniref:M20/M25/M40 family metallo-hydrolase n=1 Tax=Saliniramus sp. TaxID=2986772 RepID=UPI002C28B1BF|nr:M20/M25/M40 family metallo-hydrolase [Saliniramus sp.]HMB10966.1 M20/M25/M40 family metallo-hydrolase [Saliniramus sp.]
MDIKGLPFDSDAMLEGLRPWIECESPTWDAAAVNRMMDLASCELACMGATIERIPGRMGLGDSVRARFPHPNAGEPGILILGHLDTVHPVGTLEKLPFRRDGDICYGPGICDMKGGNYLTLEAIRQLARAGIETKLPVTIMFTPDEEIGTPSVRDLIEAEASRAKVVLVPEPGRDKGGVTSGRYAIARFNIATIGRPSHAGARLSDGRSAIREMARRIIQIEEMTTDACTFSVGVIHAGQWVNCVSSRADAEVLTMAKRQEDLDAGVQKMLSLATSSGDVVFDVRRGVTRPVWEVDQRGLELCAMAEDFHKRVGMPFYHESSGGGSDGNFTGAMGIPTLDGLGVEGAMMHTLQEHIRIETLASRGRVMAGLLATLS